MELNERLLVYLRAKLGGAVAFAVPPVRLSGGFDTTVMAFALANAPAGWQGGLVLRVMAHADRIGGIRVRREAATHAALVAAGFPAPRILASEPDAAALGKPFLIMTRLAGDNMRAALSFSRADRLTRELAETHARIHRVPGEALLAEARAFGLDPKRFTLEGGLPRLSERIDAARLEGLRPAFDWIVRYRPAPAEEETICHGDYHPLNVIVSGDRVSGVIDWANAIVAEPAYDVAGTRVILRCGDFGEPAWTRPAVNLLRRVLIARYTQFYRRARPLETRNLAYFEALVVLSQLIVAGEKAGHATNQWGKPHLLAGLLGHFETITGLKPRL